MDGATVPAYFEVSVAPQTGEAAAGAAVGRLEVAHLADHPAAAAALAEALKPGAQLGPLLVLQRLEVGRRRVTCQEGGTVVGHGREAENGARGRGVQLAGGRSSGEGCCTRGWHLPQRDSGWPLCCHVPHTIAHSCPISTHNPPKPPSLPPFRLPPPAAPLLQNVKQLRLTRKATLLSAAASKLLPGSVEEVAEGSVLAGYVASVTRDAVFVR